MEINPISFFLTLPYHQFVASGFKCFNPTFVSDLSMSKTTGLPYVATAKRDIIAKSY